MNCDETRENMVGMIEGLLEADQAREVRAHLETCETCRQELSEVSRLQERLVSAGRVGCEVSIVEPVMHRVRQEQQSQPGDTIMTKIFRHRWTFGFGAAAAASAVLAFILLPAPRAQATAAQVLERGARAVSKLTSIHFRGRLRASPTDNFGTIDTASDFCPIELWKQWAPERKWRVEKPGRVAVMDGRSTILYIKPSNVGDRISRPTPGGAFDTSWLDRIANLSVTITNELKNALAKGWKLDVKEERGRDGLKKAVVTIAASSGLPEGDYLKNKFYENADTRRVYRFDTGTELLEAVQVYLTKGSEDVLIFELSEIEYNQAIDAKVFQLDLPENVGWVREPQLLPDNDKYASMSAEQAARAFFEGCSRQDWEEVQKFERTPVNDRLKNYLGSLEIVSLGAAFTSKAADPSARFIPYVIKIRPQQMNIRLSKANKAGRYVVLGFHDKDLKTLQEFQWSKEPAVLKDNDVYLQMTPAEVVTAYFASMSKADWTEMSKFASESDVEQTKQQFAEAEKRGIDPRNLVPEVKPGEVTRSQDGFTYVTCSFSQIKKWNLALKKDSKTGRWFVDGGI